MYLPAFIKFSQTIFTLAQLLIMKLDRPQINTMNNSVVILFDYFFANIHNKADLLGCPPVLADSWPVFFSAID